MASNLSEPTKGFEILVKNAPNLRRYFDEIVVIGCNRSIKTNSSHLTMVGKKDSASLARILSEGGYYLHLAYRDNSPNSLIEACSAGLIPLVLEGSGAQEYVENIDAPVSLLIDYRADLCCEVDRIVSCISALERRDLEQLLVRIQQNIFEICHSCD